jgi:hypothetical protein
MKVSSPRRDVLKDEAALAGVYALPKVSPLSKRPVLLMQ